MARVITFSRTFPSYHPKGGEPTFFVEQFQNSLCSMNLPIFGGRENCPVSFLESLSKGNHGYKHHTIRSGRRFKAGDWFAPRVWSGKPYNSPQIQFAPDTQVKKTWDVEIDEADVWAVGEPGQQVYYLVDDGVQEKIAKNDGLTDEDLYFWFKAGKKPWMGQIICWNESINY